MGNSKISHSKQRNLPKFTRSCKSAIFSSSMYYKKASRRQNPHKVESHAPCSFIAISGFFFFFQLVPCSLVESPMWLHSFMKEIRNRRNEQHMPQEIWLEYLPQMLREICSVLNYYSSWRLHHPCRGKIPLDYRAG